MTLPSLQWHALRATIARARLSLVPFVPLDITQRLCRAAAVPHVRLALNAVMQRSLQCNALLGRTALGLRYPALLALGQLRLPARALALLALVATNAAILRFRQWSVRLVLIAQALRILALCAPLDITQRLCRAAAVPHVLLALNVATLRLRRCNVRPARTVWDL